jgi:hypothetical protein
MAVRLPESLMTIDESNTRLDTLRKAECVVTVAIQLPKKPN